MENTFQALGRFGFTAANTIACVATCRDELCQPLTELVSEFWGEAFNFASLAGMVSLGKTGFTAAHAHGPVANGRRRFVYFVLPHIGIGADGSLGECQRAHLAEPSYACGALRVLETELKSGTLALEPDADDPELTLLRSKVVQNLHLGDTPELLGLTELVEQVSIADLERMIELTTDHATTDYAVLGGLLVHGPHRCDYVRPGTAYAVVDGDRRQIA